MQIRIMTTENYEDVYHLWVSTSGMGLSDLNDSRAGIEKYLIRNSKTCFVALVGDKIVGTILSGHDGRKGFIHHTAVALNERNHGIGNALLQAALTAFEQEKITKVALVVFNQNQIGNKFWENRGFTVRTDLTYRDKRINELRRMDTQPLFD